MSLSNANPPRMRNTPDSGTRPRTCAALRIELTFNVMANGALEYLHAAAHWFGRHPDQLGASERKVLERAVQRRTLIEDPNLRLRVHETLGERVADSVARLGGSWAFIGLFLGLLLAWILFNYLVLGPRAFDPYPFVFLNLLLSMIAALQAPVIMMSQNRQSTTDRQMAAHDYEVNLKAEIEIMALHEKMDSLRNEQLAALLVKQQQQIDLLTKLLQRTDFAGET
jgi:uncharacterized membrane protein